ncbi:MAG: response regulator transcription factor [Clostridiaceae bacterium]|nr:response regulator transcription factor [Clostridiaceae bacterium]
MSIKVLIADDDEGMRLVLKKAVERSAGFTVAGEAEDGGAALRIFESIRPDVVFLDVEMPVMSGVNCAKKIADIDPRTVIIFATAHEGYMPEAFEVYAFDYLVKPFRMQRLEQTLDRIKVTGRFRQGTSGSKQDTSTGKRDTSVSKQDAYENRAGRPANAPQKLIIRNKEGISIVDTRDIILIQREDGATAIYTSRARFVTSDSLGDIEQKLDGSIFLRCHKSYIINIDYIDKIYPYGRWTYIVKFMGTDRDALMTRESFEKLEKILA